jgi:molybdopterin-guanine dinucleotide biosynthesis protein A
VIPKWPNGYVEPLHSVYRLSSSIPAIESAFDVGERSVLDMIKRLDSVRYVPVDDLRRFDKELLTFFNINYPKDLDTANEIMNDESRGSRGG